MSKAALILFVLTLLATIVGFIRDIVLSFFYGASEITDIYLISTTIPQTISAFIGAAISSIFIPLYKKIENNKGSLDANKFTSNLLNCIFLVNIVIIIIVILFTPFFVKIFASGFNEEMLELTVNFTEISMVSLLFSTLIMLLSNFLQIHNRFTATGLASIPLNIIVIISIWFSVNSGEIYLVIGFVIASLFQLLFFIPFLKRTNYNHSWRINYKDKYLREFLKLSVPVMFGVSVYQLNIIVDKNIASHIMVGGVSLIMYSNKIIALVYGLVAVPVATVIYPSLSNLGVLKDYENMNKLILKAITNIFILIVPCIIGIMIFSDSIIEIIYGRGAFNEETIIIASSILFYYSFGLVGSSVREIAYRVYYSLQDTKTPLYNAGIAMILNMVLSVILSMNIGITGIAFGTSLSSIICAILLINGLKNKTGLFFNREFLKSSFKIVFSALVMGYISWLNYNWLTNFMEFSISFIITIVIALVVYIVLMLIMKIQEFNDLIYILKRKVIRSK